jgi:anti-sigma factor RsiW
MSTTLHLNDDDLVLHYYGEMTAGEETHAGAHLASCAECQANYTRLQRVMAFVDSAPAVEAAPGFERIAWARLAPALHAPRRGWLSWFVFSPARLAFAAGVVMLIGAAFMAGRLTRTATPAGAPQSVQQVRERILLVDLGEHLDRSQMVLVELVSAPLNDDSGGNVDISLEQSRAEQLVSANRLYRQTALSTGDAAMASVLDELERVLVDIAASPSTVTQEDLDSVRRRIESKELLFKVRVVSSQVRDRQRAATERQATRSTLGS